MSESTFKSTGLGLAIVARIIHNMNGQLQVESNIDQGTKFSLHLKFPLLMPDGTQDKTLSEDRTTLVRYKTEDELDLGIVPITVLGNTTTYISPIETLQKYTENMETKEVPNTHKRDVSTVKQAESSKHLRILYAEVTIIIKI